MLYQQHTFHLGGRLYYFVSSFLKITLINSFHIGSEKRKYKVDSVIKLLVLVPERLPLFYCASNEEPRTRSKLSEETSGV